MAGLPSWAARPAAVCSRFRSQSIDPVEIYALRTKTRGNCMAGLPGWAARPGSVYLPFSA